MCPQRRHLWPANWLSTVPHGLCSYVHSCVLDVDCDESSAKTRNRHVRNAHAQTHTSLGCNPSSNDLIADVRCVTSAGKKMQLTFPTCEVQVFKINRELCWFLLPGLYGLSHTLAHRHTHTRALAQGRSNCVSNTDPGPLPVSGSKTRLPCSLVTSTGTALHSLWNTAPPTACGRHLCGPSVDSLPVHRG